MKWYLVTKREEGCGDYGCPDREQQWIVAANDQEEALSVAPHDYQEYEGGYYKPHVMEFPIFPDLSRKKKPFVWKPEIN